MVNKTVETIKLLNIALIGIFVLCSLLLLFIELFFDSTPLIIYIAYVIVIIFKAVFDSIEKKYLRKIGLLKTFGRNKNITNSLIISLIFGVILFSLAINKFLEDSEINFLIVASFIMFYMSYLELSAHYIEINETLISKLNLRNLPIKKIRTVDFDEDNKMSINTAKKSIIVDLKKLDDTEGTKLHNAIQEIIKKNNYTHTTY